jgi:acyl-CoA synthetase (NDP forming)/GNAT superfamily N-acetyltransferase
MAPTDADAIVALHSRLSERTRYLRYFSPYPRIPPRDLERFVNVDHRDREALVAELGGDLLAVARYERMGPEADEAEVAFVVEDAHQGRGLGSVLMEHLAAAAAAVGITRFVAEVLPGNARMLRVFSDAGYEVARRYADGVVHLTFPIAPTARSLSVQWGRERRAEARAVARLLNPGGIAVFGARADGTGLGAAALRHLREGGYTGPVLAVPRDGRVPQGAADLAVIVVPAPEVAGVIAQCAAAGVSAVLVVTAGFDPVARADLVRQVRGYGIRLVGPASLGIANAAIGMNATLWPYVQRVGRVGFFTHSAALGIALLNAAGRRGMGLSTFVSAGDRGDVSGNDLLQYWHDDPATDVVLLYLETFGNPRKFSRIARELTRRKPVVAVAPAGAGADPARGMDAGAVAALFASSGVIRVDTVTEMLDTGVLLAGQPLPAGTRIGVVCDAEVFAVVAAGAAPAVGLSVTAVRPVPAGAGPVELAAAVRDTLADPATDAVLVAYAPPVPDVHEVAVEEATEAVTAVARDADKPVLAVFPGGPGAGTAAAAGDRAGGVPTYPSVEEAVRALGRVAGYAAWRREPAGELPDLPGVDPAGAAEVLSAVEHGWTAATPGADDRAGQVLARYGIEVVPGRRVSGEPGEVAAVAAEVGLPVALKAAAEPWRHRVDLGAVRLNLATAGEVARAHAQLRDRFGPAVEVVVQRMAVPGVPCVVRAVDDPAFGPVVGFGLGGLATDLLGDLAWCPAPLTDRDADRLLHGPRAVPLLRGYRETPPADTAALGDLLLRVGRLAADQPRLALVELNPVLVHERGLSVLSVELAVGAPAARPDTGPRRR